MSLLVRMEYHIIHYYPCCKEEKKHSGFLQQPYDLVTHSFLIIHFNFPHHFCILMIILFKLVPVTFDIIVMV